MRGQGSGGVRMRGYADLEECVRDGLRLSRGMGRKSAMAGIWWGGGKGIISLRPDKTPASYNQEERKEIMNAYGSFISSIRGCYYGAEDAGLNMSDCDQIFATTRFTTCVNPKYGGSGNPSAPTARGVIKGMEASVYYQSEGKTKSLEGKSVAVQGVGNVGSALVQYLLEEHGVKEIKYSEASESRVKYLLSTDFGRKYAAKLTRVPIEKDGSLVLQEDVDIVAPCAYGGILSPEISKKIRAKIICGAANNQMLIVGKEAKGNEDLGFFNRGVLYAPDFVVNRMGIVNCADEGAGNLGFHTKLEDDPLKAFHLSYTDPRSVFKRTIEIFDQAKRNKTNPVVEADKLADKLVQEHHPIYGHRSQLIINSLVRDKWYLGSD